MKKIIVFYAVSEKHIKNYYNLKNNLNNYDFILVYDKNINYKVINKYNDNFYILNSNFYKIIKKKLKYISFLFLSTNQARFDPMYLSYFFIKYNIPLIALQETHQFYLHNDEMNNYILPSDKYLVSSNFEKNKFINYGYDEKKIEVIGWNYSYGTNSNITKTFKKYALFILNASKDINPISPETTKIQLDLIKKLYQEIGNKFKIIVKLHPAEIDKNNKIIKKNSDKNISIVFDECDTLSLIKNASVIFSTGYTQSILESIYLNKKIIIYPIEKNMNLISDTKNIIHSFDNLSNIINKYDFNELKSIYKKNELEKTKDNYLSYLNKSISDFEFINHNESKVINLIELSFWFFYIGYKKKSKYIINLLFKFEKKKYIEILESINNVYCNNYSLVDIECIFSFLKNKNSYFVFKYILISKFYKNISINIYKLNHFYENDPKYLSNIFFNNYQDFLNFLLYKNEVNKFKILYNNHLISYPKLYSAKSNVHKLYLLLRSNYLIINYLPFFKTINYLFYKKLFIK
ncbi:MAG: hypothetical protein CMI90_05855 [Pelagibacteraceae bacterium]|nr:hypothetical protein [Pelagibacteraceae bacterium]